MVCVQCLNNMQCDALCFAYDSIKAKEWENRATEMRWKSTNTHWVCVPTKECKHKWVCVVRWIEFKLDFKEPSRCDGIRWAKDMYAILNYRNFSYKISSLPFVVTVIVVSILFFPRFWNTNSLFLSISLLRQRILCFQSFHSMPISATLNFHSLPKMTFFFGFFLVAHKYLYRVCVAKVYDTLKI